ncbi:T9SS type A sorting domain-containing protein [Aurantibacillus circumpalustris]|uniref:T9SS type A sorting domain-containing protein n=1 Tax=Aurantibacillus circumpalustris TaxID=3036359 RepID=UPI00295AA9C6|nr:T9SS type A sorting domain-containing protein [Aurantibacillus circumpalustris]
MKKEILSATITFVFCYCGLAQQSSIMTQTALIESSLMSLETTNPIYAKSASTTIYDTLDYFFLKHYYRNPNTPPTAPANLQFTTLKSPYTNTLINIGACGASFYNTASIQVHGLKGLVIKQTPSTSQSVPVKLYLCNAGLTGIPIMPPLDSVLTSVSSSTSGVWVGGSFTSPVNVTGNFTVLFKNGSTFSGDTVRLFLNNAFTSTATTVPLSQRYGEGLGIMRFNGIFQKTTGAFGGSVGNDYEFVVSAYVSFNMNAVAAAVTPSICNYNSASFVNNSDPIGIIENRQFNFNKFKPYWAPTNALMPLTDSIYNWTFTGSTTGPSTLKNPTAFFNVLGTQSANLIVKYKRSRPVGQSQIDVNSAQIDVNNGSAPIISVSGQTKFCGTSSVTTTLFCSGSTSYTWAAPLNSVSPFVTITQTASSAVYSVSALSSGCTAVKVVTITIDPVPSVSLTINTPVVCTKSTGGSTLALTGVPSGGVYSGANVSGSNFNPPSIAGTFSVIYSYTNSTTECSNTATKEISVVNCSGLVQNNSNPNLVYYPNPVTNGLILLKNLEGSNKIQVFDVLGRSILTVQSDKIEVEIDLSDQARGNYFLKVTHSNGSAKILKIVNQN